MDERQKPQVPVVVPTVPRPTRRAKKDVMIALPWYKQTNPMTAFSVMGLIDRTRTAITLNFGDAFVIHTRNTLADLFLQTDLEWMLTIDDDMVVPFGNGQWFNNFSGFNLPKPFCDFNALDRLLDAGKTLVGALYFGRWRHGAAMFAEGMRDKQVMNQLRRGPKDEVRPTRWVGTGCTLIHRSVYLDIEKKFPHLRRKRDNGTRGGNWFTSSEHELGSIVDQTVDFLENSRNSQGWNGEDMWKAFSLLHAGRARTKQNSGLGMGEDVQFCIRAQQAGHQPYVDLGLVCGHVGHDVYGPYNTT
jgi:hypothetical protein